jgi:hypothetical protein
MSKVKTSGFVYIWRDRKHNRYYIGSHWGSEDDGYICSSPWMRQAYSHRPDDFKRRILSRVNTNRSDLLKEEQRWFDMVKPEEIKIRYYNLHLKTYGPWYANEQSRLSVGEKISAAKKGKQTGPRDPSIGEKISEVKKKKFAERRKQTGSSFTEEHRKTMSDCRIGVAQSEESNKKRSKTLKQKYESGELIARSVQQSEESNRKRSEKLIGIAKSDDTKKRMSKAQSKQYLVKFINGTEIIVNGLKAFCTEHGIPYITATKALRVGGSIKKYSIALISLI